MFFFFRCYHCHWLKPPFCSSVFGEDFTIIIRDESKSIYEGHIAPTPFRREFVSVPTLVGNSRTLPPLVYVTSVLIGSGYVVQISSNVNGQTSSTTIHSALTSVLLVHPVGE